MTGLRVGFCRRFLTVLIGSLLASTSLMSGSTLGDKMKPEEIVAKHLASIGSEVVRAAIKSRMIVGTAKATFHGRGTGMADGVVVLASEGEKNLLGMKFASPDYPFEKMGYDGKNFTVGYIKPGTRSVLGSFLLLNESAFRQGLLGGVLSSAWPLLKWSEANAKLEYGGIKTIGSKKLHEVKYYPRTRSDLSISLFFDTETFQHVRTEYKRVISASIGRNPPGTSSPGLAVDNSANQSETRYKMVEEFSDFNKEGDLTLPHSYKLHLELTSATGGSVSYDWNMALQKFVFNQPIDAKEFDMGSD